MSSSVVPYFHVNTMSGTKYARLVEDPGEYAHYVLGAQRPLLVIGPLLLRDQLGGKLSIEHALEISKALNVPICATAHTPKKLRELGVEPDSTLDIIEILNHLKNPAWKGVRGEGNHDLVMFFGIRSDLGTQGLSSLKHFAPHVKTMTLDRYYFPNANYSMQNFRREDKYHEFLDTFIKTLKTKEA